MLQISDPVEALDFDLALAFVTDREELETLEDVAGHGEGGPFGLLFALLMTRL